MNVVFVFAHQDDEIALASRIRHCVARGDRVTCLCLTDGAFAVPAAVRDAESRRLLAALGAGALRVGQERIRDGTLVEHLDRALELVAQYASDADEIVTLAWEGGHQDHDAAHLVAAVFARKRGIRCLEMPLYNGHNAFGPFFRVAHPVGEGWTSRKISWREKFANVWLVRFYPSQRRTWLGLMPQMLLARARELTREADLSRVASPPHPGPLLYERRFHYPYERFAAHAAEFLRRQSVRS
jgi:LmbE family N-acetylglucosaminyl deacetylase